MTRASPPPIDTRSARHDSAAVATRVGGAFVRAIVSHDFDALEALLAPDVRFRALTPRAVRLAATASGARDWIEGWFGETDGNELIESRVEMVADRLHLAYRIRLREDGTWHLVEQQLFGSLDGSCLTDVALVCSGFRPLETPPGEDLRSPDLADAPAVASPAQPNDAPADLAAAHPATPGSATQHERRVDARLDAIGKSCATLTPDIRAAVRQLEPGQVLEILADDPTAEDGLRAWARLTGNELVDVATRPDATGYFYVRRGAGSGTALPHGRSSTSSDEGGPASTPRATQTGAES
jgi:tRNA 2-thiouridine synthesizing protein A